MSDPSKTLALKKPCANCPFRKEGAIELRPGRVEGIIKDLLKDDHNTFQCHKTTHTKQVAACYGAMTYLLKAGRPNIMMRLGLIFKMLDFDLMRKQFDKIIEVKND